MSFVAHIHPGKASWVRFSNWRMEKKTGYSLLCSVFSVGSRQRLYFKWMGNELKCFLTRPKCI
ncbi:Uncharacterized protein APZ42_027063 [Daphnia magna]|uniref:Uncharacterized protein n=1 Tax=Daphnia magna TaxID=35525 RepID=A0A164RQ71_9CRUS|nr:Uncharacterized protein APZ42_027063 [Daphnia magna]